MNKWASYAIYPATLLGAFTLYFITYSFSHSLFFSLYVGVSTSAAFIFILEKITPLNRDWLPTYAELASDIFQYTIFIQALLPLALFFTGMKALEFFKIPTLNLWPSSAPVFLQFILMAIIGEFFQYWWHRFAHTYKIFWSVHAIHHFPQKLYAWNTARFHPLDKLVEFLFTVFIFFALGMKTEVFAYYYLFYAVTGYFQHSNIDIKLGFLDYVIASGETHRFHHNSNYELSKCNYANNLVLFDLLFGTFKRDPSSPLKVVGVKHQNLPTNFSEELFYPFHYLKKMAFNALLDMSMKKVERTFVKELADATIAPRKVQEDLLLKIIQQNAGTLFGKEHRFAEIKTYEDFAGRVPIRDFEGHRPYIEQIFEGTSNVLTAEGPHYFAKTSGTTGKPKYIPITLQTQKRYQKTQQLIAYAIYRISPNYLNGDIFSIVGTEVEEVIHGKWPCGSMSGKLYSLANPIVRAKHVFQTDISLLNDSEKKYLYLAALALLSPKTTFYASPNPSTLVKIIDVINNGREDLKKLLASKDDQILKKVHKFFGHALHLLESPKPLTVRDVWPQLKTVTMWMEGSCSYLIPRLRQSAAQDVYFNELGYVASEFYGSAPVGTMKDVQVPTILDNFFEFIERTDYENGSRKYILIDQLVTGKEYYIIATTTSGLYRYFINDVIKVTGQFNQSPVIVFSQKGKGVTSLTGEKLTEKQIVTFFDNRSPDFFLCLADQQAQTYQLYIESTENTDPRVLETELDNFLKSVNIEFASKRKDERLPPIRVAFLKKGTMDLFKAHCLSTGQREAQFKFLHLQYKKDVTFDFTEHLK